MNTSPYEVVLDKGSNLEGGKTLVLRGRFGTSAASDLRDAVLQLETSVAQVTLDCRELEFLGGAALQVLLVLQRQLQERGASLTPVGPNEEVESTLAMAGIGPVSGPG
jgi:anti-anti-sigma factor